MSLLFKLVFNKPFNYLVTRALRPFSAILPQKFKIPVWGTFRLRLPDHKSININLNYTCWHGRLLFWDGFKGYEHEVTRQFIELIRDKEVFLDIGANIGYYSLLAKTYNPKLQVHAYEPLPDAVHFLEKNIRINGFEHCQVHQLALADKNGASVFESRVSKDFPNEKYQIAGDSSLVNYDNTARKQIKVRLQTLDDFIYEKGITRVDYIKMDTETTEHLILKGAESTIKKFRPLIQCEVIKGQQEADLKAQIKALDYSVYLFTKEGLKQLSDFSQLPQEKNDCLFVPIECNHAFK